MATETKEKKSGRRLASSVHVVHPETREVKVFKAGDEVPDEWAKFITNERAFGTSGETAEPKAAGPGESYSGRPELFPGADPDADAKVKAERKRVTE